MDKGFEGKRVVNVSESDGPKKRKPRKKRVDPKFIPDASVEKIIASTNIRYITGLRNRLVLEMMYRMGMRVGEVCGLQRRHIHPDDDWLVEIREGKTGDRPLWVPLQMQPLMEIWMYRRTAELPKSQWLFPTTTGAQLNRNYVGAMLKRMCKRAGVPPTHPHALRHTFAHYFLDHEDVATLQRTLGHTSPQMSLRYAAANDQDVKRALRKKT